MYSMCNPEIHLCDIQDPATGLYMRAHNLLKFKYHSPTLDLNTCMYGGRPKDPALKPRPSIIYYVSPFD
jgi:hypothetical protein